MSELFDPVGLEKAQTLIRAMNNQNRLLVLCLLCDGPRTVTEMSDAVGLSLSAMSQHLTVLKKADLIEGKKSSQTVTYRLKTDDVQQVIALFKQLYCDEETND